MSRRPIMDAGPGLNFLALNQERLLFDALGPLSVPETVETEILAKARRDTRFAATEKVWHRLPDRLLEILPDDATADLAAAVDRLTGQPFEDRTRIPQDLGETMVIAHAVVAAESGKDILVLIDDGDGCRTAASEARRLDRLRLAGSQVGRIRLIHTTTVLERAAGGKYLPDKTALQGLYKRLRVLDDGLPPIGQTGLLTLQCWA